MTSQYNYTLTPYSNRSDTKLGQLARFLTLAFFLIGLALTGNLSAQTLTVDTIVPSAGPASNSGSGFTTIFGTNHNQHSNWTRGQTFTTSPTTGANQLWSVSEIALRSRATTTYPAGDAVRVWLFAWNPEGDPNDVTNWITGDGVVDGDVLDGTTVGEVLINGVDYPLPTQINNNDYLHFQLDTPLLLEGDKTYGMFFYFVDANNGSGEPTIFRISESTNNAYTDGLQLRTQTDQFSDNNSVNTSNASRDLSFWIVGETQNLNTNTLSLAPPFQDGMVLQRGKAIKVWGQADPSTPVEVTIRENGNISATATGTSDANGDWLIELPALAVGQADELIATSGNATINLTDVVMGDIWITFGQSNMVRPLSEMQNNTTYINDITTNRDIRCLKVTQYGALTPQDNPTVPSGHYVNNAMEWLDNTNPGSWTSVGAVFAHQMNAASNVPTAIIWAAWGSSSIEGWMPAELRTQLPHFDQMLNIYQSIDEFASNDTLSNRVADLNFLSNESALIDILSTGWISGTNTRDIIVRTRPNVIYNQMIHPFLNYGISGFVWYQGEANAGQGAFSDGEFNNAIQYNFSLPRFITKYREIFNQGDLPFLAVQLPSFSNGTLWPWFREAQDSVFSLPNAYRAVTIDTGLVSGPAGAIHPIDKEQIGIRLARLGREFSLGESIDSQGPTYNSISINGDQVTITFDYAAGLTTNNGFTPAQFEVAGADEVYHSATSSSISGNTVTVSSTSVTNPVAVRYAWSANIGASLNLIDGDDLPAAPFRSDNFAISGLAQSDPQAGEDNYVTNQNETLSVPANGVLDNDFDLNGDALSAILVSPPQNGQLVLGADGSFVYTPDSGFGGSDSFTYNATQNSPSSSSLETTVNLNVIGQNTGYYLWKENIAWTTGDNENYTGDPEGDGINNLLEYALGLDPLVNDRSGLPTISSNGGNIEYDFNNVTPGIRYEVLLSTDLSIWTEPAFMTLTSDDATPLVIPDTEASADGKLFMQLRVSEDIE